MSDRIEAGDDWKRAHAELARIANAKHALDWEEARWLRVAWRTQAHVRMGLGTFGEYLARLFGYSPRMTEEKLRVAQALEHLPQLDQALREGLVSWSVARELSRVATAKTEAEWLAVALHKTVREVERSVSGHKPGDLPTDPVRPEAETHVFRAQVSPETLATLREAFAKLRRDAGEPLDLDAMLLLLARHELAGPSDDGRASYQVRVTVCDECRAGTQDGKGEAFALAPEIVEMTECDAQHVGSAQRRATQTIPPAIRREVMRRHGHRCGVPGCSSAVFVDVHHIDPREDGGTHDPERMIVICGAHHRAVHSGKLAIDGRASDGFVFRHADGSPYGAQVSPARVETATKVFQALRQMGFKETDARRAVSRARSDRCVATHVGGVTDVELLLRAALAELGGRAKQVRDPARASYAVGSVVYRMPRDGARARRERAHSRASPMPVKHVRRVRVPAALVELSVPE